jgi:hypothetical protein
MAMLHFSIRTALRLVTLLAYSYFVLVVDYQAADLDSCYACTGSPVLARSPDARQTVYPIGAR